jgi:CheY-like chemotaxis protein
MNSLSILYVDDEADIREVAAMSLEMDGAISVRTVGSGPEALALLDAGEWRPDAILLDVMMPGMDGPTTLSALRRRATFDDVPVIFITARAQQQERDRFLASGGVGVIAKPFDPLSLAREVRSVLSRT